MQYINREIDKSLEEWKNSANLKPMLLRGARQVGKSRSVKHFAEKFAYYIEVNFERRPELCSLFETVTDVHDIVDRLSMLYSTPVVPGKTLLFLDEIQSCPAAIKRLWFFKEDFPELHVVAAGSLLEFALKDIGSYGVGRIRSMFMYPLSFEEFLVANGKSSWVEAIKAANFDNPVPSELHNEIVQMFRIYMLVGGMPAGVAAWVETHAFQQCQRELKDIQQSYYDDFAKYAGVIDPQLLRATLGSVALQTGKKFVYSRVEGGYRSDDVKKALALLIDAGIVTKVSHTSANGLPLGLEVNEKFSKYMYLDTGLLLQMLEMDFGTVDEIKESILVDTATDLVNKGGLAELVVGWEMIKSADNSSRKELFYWENLSSGTTSEVDYVTVRNLKITPIEVKAGTIGKMKSLRVFMEKKNLKTAYRTSLENFGKISLPLESGDRTIYVIPIYAISRL
jgi:predicted AAA+ superfamily ATPase